MSIARAASNACPAQPAQPAPGRTGRKVTVFLVNGTRVSTGESGPGPVELPADEASALVAHRLAWPGDRPPEGFQGAS